MKKPTFVAEFRLRLDDTITQDTYILSGQSRNSPNEPGTYALLTSEDSRIVWNVEASGEDFRSYRRFVSSANTVTVGDWLDIEFTYNPTTEIGRILVNGMDVTEDSENSGVMYESMSPVSEIGYEGKSGNFSLTHLYLKRGEDLKYFQLFEESETAVEKKELAPIHGSPEVLDWDSGKWRKLRSPRVVENTFTVTPGFQTGSERDFGFVTDTSPYGNIDKRQLLPFGLEICQLQVGFLNATQDSISNLRFRVQPEGDFSYRNFKARITRISTGDTWDIPPSTSTSGNYYLNNLGSLDGVLFREDEGNPVEFRFELIELEVL